jgi:radical SAM superfamily enzyme YgiQ (UPF0313 family)
MLKVALIRPLYDGDESEFQEPLGVERLAGWLEARGVEARQFDRRLYERTQGLTFWDGFADAFPLDASDAAGTADTSGTASAAPELIGLSVMSAEDVPDALRLISRLKAHYPNARFIVGGLYVTTAFDDARRRFPADVPLICGEGETSLLDYVDTGEPDSGASTSTPDTWASPSRPNLERYLRLGCAISLQSSRGCHGSCSFCATPELPAPYRRWQGRSVTLVVDEIETLSLRVRAAGLLPIFNFVDDDFGSLERVEALGAELARRRLRIAYALQLRVGALLGQTRLAERLEALRRGGFTRVFIGVESLNPLTLRRWNKPYDTGALAEIFSALRQAGISAHIGYILWHADSTVEAARKEAKRLWDMRLYCPKVAESRLVLFPGSRLYAAALDAEAKQGEVGATVAMTSTTETQTKTRAIRDTPTTRAARWQPLSAEAERFYQQLSERLRPVYAAWKEGAVLAPWLAGYAHLSGDETLLDELNAVLGQCDRYSYRAFVHDEFPAELAGVAEALTRRIEAIRRQALPQAAFAETTRRGTSVTSARTAAPIPAAVPVSTAVPISAAVPASAAAPIRATVSVSAAATIPATTETGATR